MNNVVAIIVTSMVLGGCVSDPTTVQPVVPVPSATGVYILNEGLWEQGNASLSYYNLESFQVYNDVFNAANGRPLGDVGNQITIRGGRAYIVVNNSDRIEIIDVSDNRSVGTINVGAGKSPRQLAFVNDSLALVTSLYDNSVLALNLKSMQAGQRIPVGTNPEGIAVTHGKAYVANSGFGAGTTVSVIDLASWQSIREITVPENPAAVLVSPDGFVCVVCAGSYGDFQNPDDDTPARLAVIDPTDDHLAASVLIGGHAFTMALDADGIGFVPTTDSVVTVDTRSRHVIGTFRKGSYYGVGVERVSGDVYLTDVKNYAQPGTVEVYSSTGLFRTSFTVGLVPGTLAFKRPS